MTHLLFAQSLSHLTLLCPLDIFYPFLWVVLLVLYVRSGFHDLLLTHIPECALGFFVVSNDDDQ